MNVDMLTWVFKKSPANKPCVRQFIAQEQEKGSDQIQFLKSLDESVMVSGILSAILGVLLVLGFLLVMTQWVHPAREQAALGATVFLGVFAHMFFFLAALAHGYLKFQFKNDPNEIRTCIHEALDVKTVKSLSARLTLLTQEGVDVSSLKAQWVEDGFYSKAFLEKLEALESIQASQAKEGSVLAMLGLADHIKADERVGVKKGVDLKEGIGSMDLVPISKETQRIKEVKA